MCVREASIMAPNHATHGWLLESADYLEYLQPRSIDGRHRIAHIKGTGGTGKSTLIKLLAGHTLLNSGHTAILSWYISILEIIYIHIWDFVPITYKSVSIRSNLFHWHVKTLLLTRPHACTAGCGTL